MEQIISEREEVFIDAVKAAVEKANETPVDKKSQALMSLVTGKRHMLVQDIPAAVSSLGEACELLSEEFGETAPECAEAYFYYGKALLEMARLESGVLGNALDGGRFDLQYMWVYCMVWAFAHFLVLVLLS